MFTSFLLVDGACFYNISKMAKPVPSRTYYAQVRKHEPWKDDVPEKKLMSEQEIYQKLDRHTFSECIKENEKKCSPPKSNQEARKIQEDVEKIANGVVSNLSRKFKLFEGSSLLKTGSTYEGVKIGNPDEFDYMIEVPALSKDIIEIRDNPMEGYVWHARVKDVNFFHDIYPSAHSESISQFSVNFFMALKKIVMDYIQDNLPPNWSMAPKVAPDRSKYFAFSASGVPGDGGYSRMKELSWAMQQKVAITPHLIWSGNIYRNMEVSLDFCLAIPTLFDKRDSYVYFPSEPPAHAAANMSCHVLLLTRFCLRMSFSKEEQRIMKQYPYPDGQNRCMRLLKFLRDERLTEIDPETGAPLTGLPTYWIKTILYGMYQEYPHASQWQSDYLGVRVVQALDRLIDACARIDLPSFFLPNCNLLRPESGCRQVAEKVKGNILYEFIR